MIEIKDLAFSYKEKEVLKNISFAADAGDILAILGKNAVGKTTLINVLTGLLEAQAGNIFICGEDTTKKLTETIKSKIGVMRPIVGVFEKMTCLQYLEFVAGLYGISRAKILELSEKYQFSSELTRMIKKCSTGTRKKVEFCAATIHDPLVLFLDEPFESVDPVVVSEIKEYIRNFSKNGRTILITSHILDIVQNICTKYIIIDNGTVVHSGEIANSTPSANDVTELERIFLETVNGNEKEPSIT